MKQTSFIMQKGKKRLTAFFVVVRWPLLKDYACTKDVKAKQKVKNKCRRSRTSCKTTSKGKNQRGGGGGGLLYTKKKPL